MASQIVSVCVCVCVCVHIRTYECTNTELLRTETNTFIAHTHRHTRRPYLRSAIQAITTSIKIQSSRYRQKARYTYKAIPARFARLSVGYNHSLLDISKLFKEFPQTLVGRVIRQATDKDFSKSGILLVYGRHGPILM